MSSRVHGSSGQEAIREFNIGGSSKQKKMRGATKKMRGGASEPYPGGRFLRSPVAEVEHRRPFFSPARRSAAVRMGRGGTARPPEAEWSSGVAVFWGGVMTIIYSKIQKNVTTTTLAF